MSDREVLVRHIGGETSYDTATFATEDKTGVLLIYSDASQKQVIAAYNPQGWIAAEVVDKVVNDDDASPD